MMRAHPEYVDLQIRLGFTLVPGAVFWLAMFLVLLSDEFTYGHEWNTMRIIGLLSAGVWLCSFIVAVKEFCSPSRWQRVPSWVAVWQDQRRGSVR